eukprot:scaffold3808_cov112-Isochrysis_galbana.AAC.13
MCRATRGGGRRLARGGSPRSPLQGSHGRLGGDDQDKEVRHEPPAAAQAVCVRGHPSGARGRVEE